MRVCRGKLFESGSVRKTNMQSFAHYFIPGIFFKSLFLIQEILYIRSKRQCSKELV